MSGEDDVEDLKARRICVGCIGDAYLQTAIVKQKELGRCSYCKSKRVATLDMEELAQRISSTIEEHFERTATEPDGLEYAMVKHGGEGWERHGQPVGELIAELAQIEEEPAEDLRRILEDDNYSRDADEIGEEGPYDDEAHYAESRVDDVEFQSAWSAFETSVGTKTRFFNKDAAAVLDMVFEGLKDATSWKGQPVICTCGPDTDLASLHRARVFQSDHGLDQAIMRPDKEVGAPPSAVAAAGRMNAKGISVFYGATSAEVALAEVRPPVGCKVVVAKFDLVRRVRLLDVDVLEKLLVKGSYFDPAYGHELKRAKFLKRLSRRITMPVMPSEEGERYLVTQAMADYLAGRDDLALDGILFRSVQVGASGANVMLFHRAARCEEIKLPVGTSVKAYLVERYGDEEEPDYSVWEEVPKTAPELPKKVDPFPDWPGIIDMRDAVPVDDRVMTLRVDTAAIMVKHVKAVKFDAVSHNVKRHRRPKSDREIF